MKDTFMKDIIEGVAGRTIGKHKSPIPARLDYIQSATGLFLGLFMWAHMFFVSSILISKDFMYSVTKFFEADFIIDGGTPITVFVSVAIVTIVFIVHASLAARKFPVTFRQFRAYRSHMKMMRHEDTNLWFWQAFTGFAMFFLCSIHLYTMLTHSGLIGPYASSDRVVSEWMWPLYILLLLAVELHGSIGLYRLCVKWGWFEGKNYKESRKKLKKIKWILTAFFLGLGLLTLMAYIKIGIEHSGHVGERYIPAKNTTLTQNSGER